MCGRVYIAGKITKLVNLLLAVNINDGFDWICFAVYLLILIYVFLSLSNNLLYYIYCIFECRLNVKYKFYN